MIRDFVQLSFKPIINIMYLIGWKLNTKGATFDLSFWEENNSVARKPWWHIKLEIDFWVCSNVHQVLFRVPSIYEECI